MRQDTLLFLIHDEERKICLAMKKRGFGVGKLNGVGGKVGKEEKIEAAAVREAHEEIGVKIKEKDLIKVAELTFHFAGKPDWDINCHVFLVRVWMEKPTESEEMAPEWFDITHLPYDKMWVDDRHWLPTVLRGNYVLAEFNFNNDGSVILHKNITIL